MKINDDFVTILKEITNSEKYFDSYIDSRLDSVSISKIDDRIVVSYTIATSKVYKLPLSVFVENYLVLPDNYKIRFMDKAEEYFNIQLPEEKVQIWPSNKIRYAYLEDNYVNNCGPLGNSCMRYSGMQKALNFYIKNNVEIVVIVTKNNKIKARALLWKNVSIAGKKNKVTYLDRVYYSTEKLKQVYTAFATKNNFPYYGDKSKNKLYIKDINIKDITHIPYTDTFRFLYYKDCTLSNTSNKVSVMKIEHCKDIVELTHTSNNGYYKELDKNCIREVLTGNYVSKKDCTRIKKYGGYVLKQNIVIIDNIYYSNCDKDITCLRKNNQWCLRTNIVNEKFTNAKIDKTKAKFIERYDGYVTKENIIYIKKEVYSKYDIHIITHDKKYYLISNCYKNILSDSYIPKDIAVIAYYLGFKEYTNKFIITPTLFGTNVEQVFYDTEQMDKVPELFGPCYINPDETPCLELNTGESIIKEPPANAFIFSLEDRLRQSYIIKKAPISSYIIRRNKKNYLRHLYEFKDKKQLTFSFIGDK